MQDTVKITEFHTNEISEEERIKASEKAYHQAEQSIRNEKMLKSSEYPKDRGMSGWHGVYLHDIAEELKNIREILEKQSTTEQSSMVGERRGKWVRCKAERMIIGYECSECGEVCRKTEYIPECDFHTPSWKYCPNCGCYMKD